MFSLHTSTQRGNEGEDIDQGQEENSPPEPPGLTQLSQQQQEKKMKKKREEQPQRREHRHLEHHQQSGGEYFDLNVLKGAVSFNTKPFKHRELVWIGFKKVLLFPFCWQWWLVRISRARYLAGCTLYILHNMYTWLYIRGCLPRQQQQQQLPHSAMLAGDRLGMDVRVTQIEILLPYVLAILFGIGYGSVVAAGGWEALRVPPCPRRGVAGGSKRSGNNNGVGAGGYVRGRSGGIISNGSDRIARRDSREGEEKRQQQQQAHAQVVDYDDEEDYEVDDDEEEEFNEAQEEESTSALGGGDGSSRSDGRVVERGSREADQADGDVGTSNDVEGVRTRVTRGDGAPSSSAALDVNEADVAAAVASEVGLLSALDVRFSGVDQVRTKGKEFNLGGGIGGAGGEGSVASCDGGTSVGSSLGGGMAGLFQQPSFSGSEGDVIGEDEEEDDDGGGWGHVIVKPVKVARWDELGQRSKSYLSLNQLRALIIERAESIPQKITYRRAAKLGILATVCLPALFNLSVMVARAWIDVGHPPSTASEEAASCPNGDAWVSIGVCDGGIELETLALAALWRAARAAWSLVLRALRLDAGDVAATTVTVTSLCSVAFIALPTFRALKDAERTYQRRYMYSKFFCALTSSQRARKHRLPHFSLKNVANIRVWLALRAGKTWLRRHKRERSADAVVSLAFFLSLALLTAILFEALSNREARFLSTLVHWELLVWCCSISFFLLRYLTLGANTNDRYRDTSVLLTEQINVQLRILQNSANRDSNKSSKRERLGVSSKVLELATKLLKELEGPNKLSGLSMNPLLYNVTRAVLVSALSGVMSDTLGFSVKLYKVLSYK